MPLQLAAAIRIPMPSVVTQHQLAGYAYVILSNAWVAPTPTITTLPSPSQQDDYNRKSGCCSQILGAYHCILPLLDLP